MMPSRQADDPVSADPAPAATPMLHDTGESLPPGQHSPMPPAARTAPHRSRPVARRSAWPGGWWAVPMAVLGLCGWVALVLAIT